MYVDKRTIHGWYGSWTSKKKTRSSGKTNKQTWECFRKLHRINRIYPNIMGNKSTFGLQPFSETFGFQPVFGDIGAKVEGMSQVGALKSVFFTEINHAMGTQNHEKWRFYTPNIWVITPKNEGCGFPWWWGVPNWISERLWMFLSTRKEATPWRIHSCGAHSALHLLFDLFYLKMTNITPF